MIEIQEKANTIPQELSIAEIRKYTKEAAPLIHCITNPISIHDCANIILAAGARPIMAEHPAEVAEITAVASALMLNLGNITDARIESIQRALKEANRRTIPVLLDLVGVTCSSLRREFARKLLADGRFANEIVDVSYHKPNVAWNDEILFFEQEHAKMDGLMLDPVSYTHLH